MNIFFFFVKSLKNTCYMTGFLYNRCTAKFATKMSDQSEAKETIPLTMKQTQTSKNVCMDDKRNIRNDVP